MSMPFLISVPFMVLAIAIAVGPLLYRQHFESRSAEKIERRIKEDTLAELDSLPVSPATHDKARHLLDHGKAA